MKRVALVSLWLVLSRFAYCDQILVNGDFASGVISPWTDDTRYGTGTGWLITSANCYSGTYCVTDTGYVGLEQTFAPVEITTIADVSFYANTLTDVTIDLFYQGGVAPDEFVIPPISLRAGGWEFFDASGYLRPCGTCSVGPYLVGFEVFGNASSNPTLLDDLSITTIASTPEPGTLAFFGSGLFGLFSITWIRRRRA